MGYRGDMIRVDLFILAAESPVVQKPPQIPPKVPNQSPQKIYPDEKPLLPKPKTVRLFKSAAKLVFFLKEKFSNNFDLKIYF